MLRAHFPSSMSLRVLLLPVILIPIVLLPSVKAAAAGVANGFLISPVTEYLTVNKGTTQTVDIAVQNPTNSSVVAQAVVNDFIASGNETGVPRVLLNGSAVPANNFRTLVSRIPNTILTPGEKQYIPVTITVPKNAESGGYYGVVRFTPATNGPSSGANVGLTASVGTLFLVTVPGNLSKKIELVQLSAANSKGSPSSFLSYGNVSVMVRLKNIGNVYAQPFGTVLVKNMFGSTVASYQFNNTTPRASVLQNSIRKFINPLPQKSWFGYYTINANIAYNTGGGNIIIANASFWYIPWWSWLILAAVIALLGILGYFIRNRKYRHHRKHKG